MEYFQTSMFQLREHFRQLANGEIQRPRRPIYTTLDLSAGRRKEIFEYMVSQGGPLFTHFAASIPNILEELSRVGDAIAARVDSNASEICTSLYALDAFDGTFAGAVSKACSNRLMTLTSSANTDNAKYFKPSANNAHVQAPYQYVTRELLRSDHALSKFSEGFDYLYEMAAFQFYSKDRSSQIAHVKRLLKEDGILVLLEKLNTHEEEYWSRESAKDQIYKTRYFSQEEIDWKKKNMVDRMGTGQVTVAELVGSLKKHFRYVYKIWNSTNFYELVACDDKSRISEFVHRLSTPIIEPAFAFDIRTVEL